VKVIIAGSRDGCKHVDLMCAIENSRFEITELVNGGATGVDYQAWEWAKRQRIDRTLFEANWVHRNRRMAAYADALIALPGGNGTKNMIEEAQKAGLKVYVHEVEGT
jgi:hypothetical protein